ncbi:MAG: excinuclease ABC subunit UvrC [gamma proteobacterium symbiont of Bathyaustriella thionipta]|nr:excinuclease ABC subunit UvrC [gamma proteobacterium symbiont of Bathyaustriella thionipta]
MSEQASATEEFDAKSFLKTLTCHPGVYRMIGAEGQVLYVGKARDLKRRVSSYFSRSLNARIQLMVSRVRHIEVTVTHTESEALLLENTLIKEFKPRYNVLLKDDKSYPYIYLSSHQSFPRLSFHRGARSRQGQYFGPYPNVGSTRDTLKLLQKLFPVRQCEDSFFANRSRPCLQYQIKRCSAPCVDLVSEQQYASDVRASVQFLQGKTTDVLQERGQLMTQAAERLDYEQAALYRDQIQTLSKLQATQCISGERGDLDIVACALSGGQACVQVFMVRGGRNLGNKVYYPKIPAHAVVADVLSAFLSQHYGRYRPPGEILLSHELDDSELLQSAFSQQAGHTIRIHYKVRADRLRWLKMACSNAEIALKARLASRSGMRERLENLQDILGLGAQANRIECFDISHTSGQQTVASCVVFDEGGAAKQDYRRFNIRDITAGDDYAAMHQAILRRYTRVQKDEGKLPDLLLIDGGKAQLAMAEQVMQELQINDVMLLGVAKGPDRKPGMEQLFISGKSTALILPADSPALHLIQQVRDEAHRFAIAGHRNQRARVRRQSTLEDIPGIGAKRRKQLLLHFGGLQGIEGAGVEDLCRVEGINRQLAEAVYHYFRPA